MSMQATSRTAAGIERAQRVETTGPWPLSRLSKLLHWLTAGLVLLMLVSGVLMKQLGGGALADMLYTLHKSSGATILLLVVVRLGYRLSLHLLGRWSAGAGRHPVHAALYAGLILVPLSGWAGVSDFGARDLAFGLSLPPIWPEGAGYADALLLAHAVLAFVMLAFVVVHIGMAVNDYIQRGGQRG